MIVTAQENWYGTYWGNANAAVDNIFETIAQNVAKKQH